MNDSSPAEIRLESKVAYLRQASTYPQPCFRVEAVETHMSWVFLTERHAWKLKKPVRYDYLDFSTPAARRFFCDEEVRLNRRLAPFTYLGVVPLGVDNADHLCIDDGTAVDWLVKMRRLPMQHMLDYAIQHGDANLHDMTALARRLGRFYSACAPIAFDVASYRQRFLDDIARNLAELRAPAYQLPLEHIETIGQAQINFLQDHTELLGQRINVGKIVEGHGDLRPEHVCLHPSIAIIDCLEFSRELRIIDAIDELGFLALECERLGAPELGRQLLSAYCEATGDCPDAILLNFYQSFRACLRARIAIRHLNEEKFRYSAEWRRRTLDYLELAQRHLPGNLP
jgi:aminoglycoside phosphotransferase family enzyme